MGTSAAGPRISKSREGIKSYNKSMRVSQKPIKIYFRRRASAGSQILPSRRRYFIVDAIDYEKVKSYIWHCHDHRGYVRSSASQGSTYLHRLISNAPKGKDVDHINGNTLDNRRVNLRIVTRQQNLMNSRPRRNGFKGVYWQSHRNKWRAQIVFNGEHVTIGSFDSERKAAVAYDEMAFNLYGDYAKLNFKIDGVPVKTARR